MVTALSFSRIWRKVLGLHAVTSIAAMKLPGRYTYTAFGVPVTVCSSYAGDAVMAEIFAFPGSGYSNACLRTVFL